MSISPPQLALLILILCGAGAVQGAVGFGFGLVAMSLLSGIVSLKDASVMLVFASLSLNLSILFKLRGHIRFDRLRWMIGASVVGVPLGVWLLIRADELVLKRMLGVVLLLAVAQPFVPWLKKRRWHPLWVGVPCGLFSGALSGAFSTGGPPIVAYVQSQQFDRFRYAASVQIPLLIAAVARIVCLGAGGVFTSELLVLGLVGVACAVVGSQLGLHVLKRLPDVAVRRAVLAILLLLGLKFVLLS